MVLTRPALDRLVTCEVDYAIYAGTLLGAWRHGGFIPWDNDIDVVVKKTTVAQLVACLVVSPPPDASGFVWIVRQHCGIVPLKVVDAATGYYLDVFACDDGGGTCVERQSGTTLATATVFPSRPCWFDDVEVSCPHAPHGVLRPLFAKAGGLGLDWVPPGWNLAKEQAALKREPGIRWL